MNRNRTAAAALVVLAPALALSGCTAGARTSPARTNPAPATTPATSAAPRPVTMADARHCPVTIGHPVPSSKSWRESLFGWQSAHGNGSLWVGALWPHGIVVITPDLLDL